MKKTLSKPIVGFLISALTISFGISFLNPVMSLFLVDGKGFSPIYMGIFISVVNLMRIVIGHISGDVGDKRSARRQLLLVSQWCLIIGLLGFAYINNPLFLMVVIPPLLGLGAMGFSQLFALGRLYSTSDSKINSTKLINWMRSVMSAAWIIGPPVVFFMVEKWGFTTSILMAVGLALIVLCAVTFFVPDFEKSVETKAPVITSTWLANGPLVVILLTNVVINIANNIYAISMPLYLTNGLAFDTQSVGFVFGVAAAFEIPCMLLTGYLADRIGKEKMLIIGLLSGALFYSSLLFAQSQWAIIAAQIFNGGFIGITTGLLILLVQDKMPERAGLATSLYANSMRLGNLLAGAVAGIIIQILGYKSVFGVALSLTLIGAFFVAITLRVNATQIPIQEV